MKKFTKILAVFLAAVLLVVASVGVTVAYLTLRDINPQENVFSVGDIEITLEEEVGVEGVGSVTQSSTGADYTNIMPGDKLIKEITVANPGNNPAYVALTVKVNNIDKIAAAIDNRYAAGEIQAMYDKVFTDWGLQYNAQGMSPTNVLPTDAKLLQVDAAKTDAAGVYTYAEDNWFTDYTPANNEWEFTYYLYLAPGESFIPFEGLVAPAEFDREQLAMFEGLKINAVANAIQADNTLGAKNAFAALTDRIAANTIEVASAAELDEALANAVVGTEITLDAADYGTVTIDDDLNGVTIDAANAGELSINIAPTAKLRDVTITNLKQVYNYTSGGYVTSGLINIAAGAKVENLTISNSSFNGSDGSRSVGIGCSEPTAEVNVVGCDFKDVKYALYSSNGFASMTFADCTFESVNSWVIQNSAGGVAGDLAIINSKFVECKDGVAKMSHAGTMAPGAEFTFTGNTLIDCAGHDGNDAYWFTLVTDTITVSGNTLDGAAWEPGTAQGLGK